MDYAELSRILVSITCRKWRLDTGGLISRDYENRVPVLQQVLNENDASLCQFFRFSQAVMTSSFEKKNIASYRDIQQT